MNPAAARRRRICTSFSCIVVMATAGCVPVLSTPGRIARRARAILSLDPNANWTQCVNELIRIGPASVDWLMRRRCMQRPAAPDDLSVLMHVSLVRLLMPPDRRPELTTTALQVRHGLVYFEIRVRGRRLGEAIWRDHPPTTWPALLVRGFRPALADQSDLEHDRRQLVAWWRQHRASPAELARREEYRPRTAKLWRLLAWHPADHWSPAGPAGELCAGDDRLSLTLPLARADYNLVRSACIWLGSRTDASVQLRLIDLVGSDQEVVRHNALFALGFSPDPAVRALLRRLREQPEPRPDAPGLWVRQQGATGGCAHADTRRQNPQMGVFTPIAGGRREQREGARKPAFCAIRFSDRSADCCDGGPAGARTGQDQTNTVQ